MLPLRRETNPGFLAPDAVNKPSSPHSMNLGSVTALGIGAMIGAGIFSLLGVVASVAGNQTYISFLLGGVVAVLSGYSYAKLAARYPEAGGISVFFDRAFGPYRLSGTLTLIFLLTIAATVAMVAKAFGAYAAALGFGSVSTFRVNAFASAITILVVLLNVAGSALVGKTEVVLVGIKLTILAGLILACAYGMSTHAPYTHKTPHFFSVIGSVGLTLFAYAGYAVMPNAAGSVARPKQTIPLAIYLAISIVTLLYVVLAVIVVESLPAEDFSHDADVALASAVRPVLGQTGYVVVSATALLATASGINAFVFTAMQISLSMAQGGQLPRIFVEPLWRKGTLGFLLGVATILLAINCFDLTALASIASATFVVSHMAVQVAHWRLIHETRGSRMLVGAAFLSMTVVLVTFLWSIAFKEPWSLGIIFAFILGSWMVEMLLEDSNESRNLLK
jgi:amino acid transporter